MYSNPQSMAILRRPQELLEHILSYLTCGNVPSQGMLELSATCKGMRANCIQAIGREYFTFKRFLLADERRLAVFLELSKHPVFSKTLKTVELSFVRVRDVLKREHCGDHTERCRLEEHGDWPMVETYHDACRHWREQKAVTHKEQLGACRQLLVEQRILFSRSGDLHYLRLILSNLKAAGTTLRLSAAGHIGCFQIGRTIGSQRILQQLPPHDAGYRLEVNTCDCRSFNTV